MHLSQVSQPAGSANWPGFGRSFYFNFETFWHLRHVINKGQDFGYLVMSPLLLALLLYNQRKGIK